LRSLVRFGLLVSMLAVPSVSIAAEEDEPRQPLQELIRTHIVYPQEAKELQVTFGSVLDRGTRDSLALPLALEYGLTDAWQVELEWEPLKRVSSSEASTLDSGDPVLGTQYSFMNVFGSRLHSALGIEAGFDGEVEPYAAMALDLGPHGLQVFGDLALQIAPLDDTDHEREAEWSAGALLPLARATVAAELNVRDGGLALRRAREVYVVPSVTLRPAPRWEVAVGLPIGLTRESNRFGLAFHAVYER
jgi:hypothetical protein